MIKAFKCFVKKDYLLHALCYFIFLLSTCFLIQSTKIHIAFTISLSIICFLSAIGSIIFQILFYRNNKEINKNLRLVVLFYLMIISGVIITILFLIIDQFTFKFNRTTWIAVVMIISLSTTSFGINYIY